MGIEVLQLPRGGTLLQTEDGPIQIGATPETIKDTLALTGDVPDFFVLPTRLFSPQRGISLADVEFPAYYNFFLKKRSLRVAGLPHQIEILRGVLQEAVLGPTEINLRPEFPFDVNRDVIPNLQAEISHLRPAGAAGKPLGVDDIVEWLPLTERGDLPFGRYRLSRTAKGTLQIFQGETLAAEVPLEVQFPGVAIQPSRERPFEPPLFGVTTIGSGHGFDPSEMTSGLIVWVNRRGILVDPPVDSTRWLRANDINPQLIDCCILTHCHADHDSGILQKLLEEKKIHVYTTETIMGSFVRKYQVLSGLAHRAFMGLFNFHAVTVGVPIRIEGGEFRFFYTFHSIPTIGFEVYFQGKSFVYSSDSLNDPPTIQKLFQKGVINRYRLIELINFPWHHSLIFHEAGIPPIHTPIKNLAELPEPVKERIRLIHVSEKSIPPESGLSKAAAGIDATIVIPVNPPPSNEALEYLDVLNHVDLFSELPISKAREFLTLVKVHHFKPGETIIRKGTPGDRFYMIVSGRAGIVAADGKVIKGYSNNDYFGETAMILNTTRNADVIAETELKALAMDKYDFLYFIRGTEIARRMKIIAENRQHDTWALFDACPQTRKLSATQRTQLQGIMAMIEYPDGATISRQGTEQDCFFLVERGEVELRHRSRPVAVAGRGSFLGLIHASLRRDRHRLTLVARKNAVVFGIDVLDFYRFLERNPGVFVIFKKAKIREMLVAPGAVPPESDPAGNGASQPIADLA